LPLSPLLAGQNRAEAFPKSSKLVGSLFPKSSKPDKIAFGKIIKTGKSLLTKSSKPENSFSLNHQNRAGVTFLVLTISSTQHANPRNAHMRIPVKVFD